MKGAIINYVQENRAGEYADVLESAGNIIKNGGTVIFPTETVYGLGANALDPRAAKRIYKAKGRPSDNPLIVHICDYEMLEAIADGISKDARRLMERFWPGPLTMIFYKKAIIPDETTGGLESVAVRMPANKIALRLIKEAGVPIAAPSANISGKPSITSGKYAIEEMAERVDMILMDEDSEIGIESTVVDMTMAVPVVLRPGIISQREILKALADSQEEYERLIDQHEDIRYAYYSALSEPKSPGMKYTHYSPNARLILLSSQEISDCLRLAGQGGNPPCLIDSKDMTKIRVLTTDQNMYKYGELAVSLGSDDREIGRNLFRVLRDLDEEGVELIFCEDFEEEYKSDFLSAVMNRIKKAASNINY